MHCLLRYSYIRYFYKWLYIIVFLWYALFAVIVFSLLLQMALPNLLSLVCIVCCVGVFVTFTDGFTISPIFGMHCLL